MAVEMTIEEASNVVYEHADMFGRALTVRGIRTEVISSYEIPRAFYANVWKKSAVKQVQQARVSGLVRVENWLYDSKKANCDEC